MRDPRWIGSGGIPASEMPINQRLSAHVHRSEPTTLRERIEAIIAEHEARFPEMEQENCHSEIGLHEQWIEELRQALRETKEPQ